MTADQFPQRAKVPSKLDPFLPYLQQQLEAGLRRDQAAVVAALSLPYSNGQVNRLKFIKRSMYGRANFDLLRRRVLAA